jgi:hypothetical protein
MPQRTLVAFGPCPLCGTKARAIPTATAGHRCPKDAGRWIKLELINESETAE